MAIFGIIVPGVKSKVRSVEIFGVDKRLYPRTTARFKFKGQDSHIASNIHSVVGSCRIAAVLETEHFGPNGMLPKEQTKARYGPLGINVVVTERNLISTRSRYKTFTRRTALP